MLTVLLELLVIFIVFSVGLLMINYYIYLVRSKDTYSRSEIVNPLPIFSIIKTRIADKYPVFQLTWVIILFSIFGAFITHFNHWILNSALIPALIFLIFPFLKTLFSQDRVLEYSSYYDMFKNVFIRMNEIVFYSYSFGAAATIIYSWGAFRETTFIYFLVNTVIIAVLITFTIQNNINKD